LKEWKVIFDPALKTRMFYFTKIEIRGEVANVLTRDAGTTFDNFSTSELFDSDIKKKMSKLLIVILLILIILFIIWVVTTVISKQPIPTTPKTDTPAQKETKNEITEKDENDTPSPELIAKARSAVAEANQIIDEAENSMANADLLENMSKSEKTGNSPSTLMKNKVNRKKHDEGRRLAKEFVDSGKLPSTKPDSIQSMQQYFAGKKKLLNKETKLYQRQKMESSSHAVRKQAEQAIGKIQRAINSCNNAQESLMCLMKKGIREQSDAGGKKPGTGTVPNHLGGPKAIKPKIHRIVPISLEGRPGKKGHWSPPKKPSTIIHNSFQKMAGKTMFGFELIDKGRKHAFNKLIAKEQK